jgi:hypothetical protein
MSKYSYCGIDCEVCSAYVATQNNDEEAKKKVAEEWSKMFNADIKAKDISCDGCTIGTDKLFHHCHECEVRKCAHEKEKVASCAYCKTYPCDTLNKFLDQAPELKANLEKIRSCK